MTAGEDCDQCAVNDRVVADDDLADFSFEVGPNLRERLYLLFGIHESDLRLEICRLKFQSLFQVVEIIFDGAFVSARHLILTECALGFALG